jgi:hypothetical protein
VKPRFKVGDWVKMSGSSLFCQITQVDEKYYYKIYEDGKVLHNGCVILEWDKYWKLVSDEEKAILL